MMQTFINISISLNHSLWWSHWS